MKVLSTIPWVIGGLVGGGLWITPNLVWAQSLDGNMLLAQQIVDGLPPPPPLAFGQEALPTSPAAQFPSMPSTPTQPGGAASRYLVLINGDSPLLLSQVQTLIPTASVQEYNGQRFIQAGTFSDASQAQQQVSALATQGIGANILPVSSGATSGLPPAAPSGANAVPNMMQPGLSQSNQQAAAPLPSTIPPPDLLPVTPVPREVEFGQPPAPSQLNNSVPTEEEERASAPRDARYYFIVIPGNASELTAISNQVLRLGDGFDIASMVQTSDTPRGTHVQVGPFVDRKSARRWTDYFRDFGLNARVYYQR